MADDSRARDGGMGDVPRYARIVNDFLHDMATGTWAACLLVLWLLSRRVQGMPADAVTAIASAMHAVFWLLAAALAVLAATGSVRLAYWRRETPPADLDAKRRALIVKHAAFALVFAGGTAFAWYLLP